MKHVKLALLVVLIAMSLAAGAAKVLASEQEVQLFAEAGLNSGWLLPFGILQVLGSLATVFSRTRQAGLIAIGAGFLLSAIVIFMSGNTVFAAVSLVPVILVGYAAWSTRALR